MRWRGPTAGAVSQSRATVTRRPFHLRQKWDHGSLDPCLPYLSGRALVSLLIEFKPMNHEVSLNNVFIGLLPYGGLCQIPVEVEVEGNKLPLPSAMDHDHRPACHQRTRRARSMAVLQTSERSPDAGRFCSKCTNGRSDRLVASTSLGGMTLQLPRVPVLLIVIAALCQATTRAALGPSRAFDRGFGIQSVDIRVGCSVQTGMKQEAEKSWRQNVSFGIENLNAQFLVLRFAFLKLPPGADIVIRDGYKPSYRHDPQAIRLNARDTIPPASTSLYTRPIRSRRAVVTYVAPSRTNGGDEECYGFIIDQYRFAAQSVYRDKSDRGHLHHRRLSNDQDEYDFNNVVSSEGSSSRPSYDEGKDEDKQTTESSQEEVPDSSVGSDKQQCVSGLDETEQAACVKYNPQVFEKSNSIARLLIHKEVGSIFCTGWLFGCEGHVITNHHCVSEQSEADATFIEFLAQGRKCEEACDSPMGCPGVIEASSSDMIAYSPTEALDFTLLRPRLSELQLVELTKKYGFLSMRSQGAAQNERIFIPQHPSGFGKRVGLKHDAGYGRVASLNELGCNQRLESVGYALDTRGGSSGSPVIAYDDKAVIGLHYCGGCLNSAIPSHQIIQSLIDSSQLPKCAQSEFDMSGTSTSIHKNRVQQRAAP